MENEKLLKHIRCDKCNARLFDTSGVEVEDTSLKIVIKCWRCGRLCKISLDAKDKVA